VIRLTDDYSEAVKRLLTLLLAPLAIIAFTACTNGGGSDNTLPPITTASTTPVTHPVAVFEQRLVALQTTICTEYHTAIENGNDQEQYVQSFEQGFNITTNIGPMTADDEEALFKFLDTYC
jgi:hypothetical protein